MQVNPLPSPEQAALILLLLHPNYRAAYCSRTGDVPAVYAGFPHMRRILAELDFETHEEHHDYYKHVYIEIVKLEKL